MQNRKKIIFILGNGRSGTTLLNRVLSSHRDIGFINNEFNHLFWFWKKQPLYDRYGHEKYWEMANDFAKCFPSLSRKICLQKDVFLSVNSFKEWFAVLLDYYCPGKFIAGIKIADFFAENTSMIESEFSDSYCLHIIRDPRDVFLSIKKTPIGKISPFYSGKSWAETVKAIRSLEMAKLNYHEVRYEDLVVSPAKELESICSFLEVDFDGNMLRFYENPGQEIMPYHQFLKRDFVSDNFNKWRKELKSEEIMLINSGCGETMRELGYTDALTVPPIGFFRRLREFAYSKASFYRLLIKYRKVFEFRNRRYRIKTLLRLLSRQKSR